jgi:hypothetical protein
MYGGRQVAQASFAARNLGEPWSMPTLAGSGMRPSPAGSGKPGTPWLRTHRANLNETAVKRCCSDRLGGRPPFGRSCRQAACAAVNRALLTRSRCNPTFGITPPAGSGNADTPFERMQCEKASARLGGADDVETPHAEATSESTSNAAICSESITLRSGKQATLKRL